MKKILVSILALIYLTASSGMAMEIHYCMGKKAGEQFFSISKKDKCGKCGMKAKKKSCCHDEFKFSKMEDAHKTVSSHFNFELTDIELVNPIFDYQWTLPNSEPISYVNNNSPPDIGGPSTCILNCVFRL